MRRSFGQPLTALGLWPIFVLSEKYVQAALRVDSILSGAGCGSVVLVTSSCGLWIVMVTCCP